MMIEARGRFRWGFAAIALVAVGLAAWGLLPRKAPAAPHHPTTVSVATAKVGLRDLDVTVDALGSAQAWRSVLIRPQVNGRLLSAPVREGSDVAAGAVLAQIDPAPYQALVAQAQGVLARDQALLQAARLDLTRDQTLLAQGWIAHQPADTQAALVKQYEGLVAADAAAVSTARINLGYCRIVAPWAGRVGVRLADPGALVSASDTTGLLTINELTPIAVTFTVPQGDFQRLSDASAGFSKPLSLQALSQETGAALGAGELSIADNHVDPATGTIALKARFPNPDRQLWPGQFVNVRLKLLTLHDAQVIPLAAVNQGPNGAYAYVVDATNKVSMRPIKVASTQGINVVVGSGLKPGEMVVTDGQMTLKAGMTVRVRGETSTRLAAR
jgi:multidrug efflux system membrane fusion protein